MSQPGDGETDTKKAALERGLAMSAMTPSGVTGQSTE